MGAGERRWTIFNKDHFDESGVNVTIDYAQELQLGFYSNGQKLSVFLVLRFGT